MKHKRELGRRLRGAEELSEELAEFVCQVCGAELKVTPESIVSVCEYCGGLNVVSGVLERSDINLVPSIDKDRVLEEFWKRVKTDSDLQGIADKIRIASMEGHYVPFWFSSSKVKGEVVYLVKEYRGEEVRIVRKKARFSKNLRMRIVGRRQMNHVGVDVLADAYLRSNPTTLPLTQLEETWWRSNHLRILNMEFDRAEAEIMIREESIDTVRKIWERKAHRIEFFRAEVAEMERPRLILLPLWEIIYEFKRSLYFAYHEGWTGRPLVFAEPIMTRRRTMYLAGMVLSVLGGLGAGAILSRIIGSGGSDNVFGFILIGLAIIGVIGYKSAKGFISDVRVEKSWK